MSDTTYVAIGGNASETATLLLAAAAELELDPGVVGFRPGDNAFEVPVEVAKKAGLEGHDPDAGLVAEITEALKVADQGPEIAAAANAERVAAEPVLDEPEGQDSEASKPPAKKVAAKRPARKAPARRPAKKAAAKKSTSKKGS